MGACFFVPPRKNLKKPAVVIKSSSRSIVKNTENEVYILKEKLFAKIEELEPKMVQTLCDLVAIPAISPADGGVGEFHKAEYLIKKLKELGLCDVSTYALPDPKAAGGARRRRAASARTASCASRGARSAASG